MNHAFDIIFWAFAHYVITMLFTVSHIAEVFIHPVTKRVDDLIGYPFSRCRLCIGFWISIGIWVGTGLNPLFIYGISQYLTQTENE